MAKSAFVGKPPEFKSIMLCSIMCFCTCFNMADVFSTLVSLWHAYTVDSQYKQLMTCFTVIYHGFQIVLFIGMLIYIFKIKRLHVNKMFASADESEEDYKSGLCCMVFMYCPFFANIKFLGGITSFVVLVSNRSNYFNFYYYALNFLSEALLSCLPLIVIQCYCIAESTDNTKSTFLYS